MKYPDPVIDEIHTVREELLRKHGGNLDELARAAKVTAEKLGFRVETLPSKRVEPDAKKAS